MKIGGFDAEVGRSCSDHYLWFKMAINNYKIDFVNEPLSYFFLDSSDRTSYNIKDRLNSTKILINKIKKHLPKKKIFSFKSQYISEITSPIFFKNLKEKNFFSSIIVYVQYLMFNVFFYKKIMQLLKKKFSLI